MSASFKQGGVQETSPLHSVRMLVILLYKAVKQADAIRLELFKTIDSSSASPRCYWLVP